MDFIDDFIEEYKNNPCLWKADCTNFKNRTKRQEAYLKLIEVAAKHGEHYNIERTKQKINNLRCAFRQQLKKIIESKNKGEKDEPYCPKRRYFESLMFLKDEENLERKTKRYGVIGPSNAEDIETSTLEQDCMTEGLIETNLVKNKLAQNICPADGTETDQASKSIHQNEILEEQAIEESFTEYSDDVYNKINDLIPQESNSKDQKLYEIEKETSFIVESSSSRKRSSSTSSLLSKEAEPTSKKIKMEASSLDLAKILSVSCKSHNNIEDHYTYLGKIIAHKLRTMDTSQAIYAEKIITDVLFHGQMKMLSVASINQFLNVNFSDICESVRCNK
ncbi:uncharacterized protein LOC101456662 [Ceratitis capitata]|uniref:(Mediterranean fruit fly) hypothetical protein n=1 Tax=Ceratitis capitata TaxID=7213 RepID=W8C9D5_CERCA|nr:uncharacterized protein LOC101456662 [Ceratitis capitata]CAD7013008.1 unnamed protein product [Ceratitis capitata]